MNEITESPSNFPLFITALAKQLQPYYLVVSLYKPTGKG